MSYYMPVKIIWGENCIYNNKSMLQHLGKKAFIVTGSSSSKNGSLHDIKATLESVTIPYAIFDQTEENPSVECVQKAAELGRDENCDFVVALGGGSPLDAGKAVAVLLNNPDKNGFDLYSQEQLGHVPVIAVPTTAGTGSEATAVFVLTNHNMKTKASTPQRVFPEIAFLDGRYLRNIPNEIMISTVLDSLAHSIESYLCTSANFFSERAAEGVFESFGKIKDTLPKMEFTNEILNEFLLISTLSGIAICQTATSLPHFLGYSLTYYKGIPHGRATGVLLYEYMASFKNRSKVDVIISKLGFDSLDEFGVFLDKLLYISEDISDEELKQYTALAASKPEKLKTYPENVSIDLLENIYVNSVSRYSKNGKIGN